jgi:sugar (pentulose or hexulose) kinase
MTNKKVAVYTNDLKQIDARYRIFPPQTLDGIEAHDLAAMETWFAAELGAFAREYPVEAIAVTTHGATFVCVGKDGCPVLPCVYYTHEPGDAFHAAFYEEFGAPETLQEQTGTPAFKALINLAKGIRFAQIRYPESFSRTARILCYPQYWGFRFTGNIGAEGTYMGCHGYLWDQRARRLSSVAHSLGVAPLLSAGLRNSWDALGSVAPEFARKTGLSPKTVVTMGIHDSNSALLPHFAKKGAERFALNSTGTWCVSMNPSEPYGFAPEELGKAVFFNLSAFRTPIKTANFLGGHEFEAWSRILMRLHGRDDIPPYDPALCRAVLREKSAFLLPELTAGSGQFPGSRPRIVENGREYLFETVSSIGRREDAPPCFQDYGKGFALLCLSLVMQSLTGFERIGLAAGTQVFTEGGFRKNRAYNSLLAGALPENRVFLTDIAEASALGAAMTAKMALTGKTLGELSRDLEVAYREVEKDRFPDLPAYRTAWLSLTYPPASGPPPAVS